MSDRDTASLLKFTENVLQDYRSLISETKRRFVPIKEATESQIPKLRAIINSDTELREALQGSCSSLISPFLSGCLSKNQKIIVLCLTALQRFINQKCLSEDASEAVVSTLWQLAESNVEELRILQTTILLLTSSSLIRGPQLAKAFTICLKLHLSKSPATVNTAAAAVRQCASAIFDRVFKEELIIQPTDSSKHKAASGIDDILPVNPLDLKSSERDAYMLFQDVCLLISDDTCIWLCGTMQINKVLGLELVESLIFSYPSLFCQHPAFAYLLKTNLCPLVIKLFSPSLKLHLTPLATSGGGGGGITDVASAAFAAATAALTSVSGVASSLSSLSSPSGVSNDMMNSEKPNFALFVRLKRLVIVIVNHYFHLLNTECEIYLSLLIRFLDVNKLLWQRALALEVLFKIVEQPELVKHICISYDMRQHATKIFHELLNAFGQYIQTSLANPCPGDELSKDNANQTPNQTVHVGGINQSMLYYKGSYFPINLQSKGMLLEMLDRNEPPILPDGYCLSLALLCLRKTVDSLKVIINANVPEIINHSDDDSINKKDNTSKKHDIMFCKQIVSNSWCGILSTLSLLFESSADHHITSGLLQSLQIMIELSGKLHLDESRDAFSITLCRAALPSSFGRSLLATHSKNHSLVSQLSPNFNSANNHDDIFERSGIALVISQGPGHTVHINPPTNVSSILQNMSNQTTPTGNVQSGSGSAGNTDSLLSGNILLTVKHLQAASAVLTTALAHGDVLDSSWIIFLTTMQMLNLKIKPSAKLFFKPVQESCTATKESVNSSNDTMNENADPGTASTNTATTITTNNNSQVSTQQISMTTLFSVTSELTSLSSFLTQIFIQSSELSVDALHNFISALCRLSSDALEAVKNNREPSQFPIAKLTEIGLVNVHRLDLWWKVISNQLLTVCNCTYATLRQLSSSCLTSLIRQAIAAPQNPPFWQNEALNIQVLDPLTALSDHIIYDDVREEQLKCVQQLLHCWGEQVQYSWLRLIKIIGVIRESYKLHLADFFMEQKNIPLVVSDSINSSIDLKELWISVFHKLADLCLDRRPAVRKSACQTLFNTIECHSEQFDEDTWSTLLWKILFPLLSKVHNLYQSAPVEKVGDKPNSLLIHHSRDTAAKQWAETVVLTLTGVSHCFISKQSHLLTLSDFTKCWQILLDHLKVTAYMDSGEISLASINCMQILLDIQLPPYSTPSSTTPLPTSKLIWSAYWETWLQIGKRAIAFAQSNNSNNSIPLTTNLSVNPSESQYISDNCTSNITINENGEKVFYPPFVYLPSISFITSYFDLFIPIFNYIKEDFHLKDFDRLAELLQIGVLIPLYINFLFPTVSTTTMMTTLLSTTPSMIIDDGALNSLQEAVLRCLNCLVQNFGSDQNKDENNNNNNNSNITNNRSSSILPRVLQLLLTIAGYAIRIPKPHHSDNHRLDVVPLNYIVFAEKSLLIAVDLYQTTVTWPEMCSIEILDSIIKTLHQPMALKYACPSQTTWLLACRCFFQVITAGIIVLSNKPMNMSKTYNFNKKDSIPSSGGDSSFSCRPTHRFVDLISDLFLSNPAQLPEFFISRLINLLSLGSVQSAIPISVTTDVDVNTSNNNNEDFNANGSYHRNSVDHSNNQPSSVNRYSNVSHNGTNFPKGLGLAVRQMSLVTSLPQEALMNESLGWNIDLDRLRRLTFRENFARLCFGKLLLHAFSTPLDVRLSSPISTPLSLENGHVENTNGYKMNPSSTGFSLMVSKAAVRNILQRCRSILIKFYQSSRLIGKCPLPRARLLEISYVFKALTVMLTSLQSVPIQHDVDDSIWSSIIELYPHIVDCILVTGGSSQIALALHHLLRLYGEFLAPSHLRPGGSNNINNEDYSGIVHGNNINSMNIENDITNNNISQNKTSLNGT
ncbi:hypothetical protein Smp_212080 [Schistosoma mansoni]|uniref:hypothetical protein n=1 Tax=Schistosoma mansoni TaxID=6183 RepID=UPI00022DC168|nr:hypothetical protein Smp_212080 [Schistosoma mansoni]|eukprot:XP_018650113.1 hypothetical protein Smp_212080 [Schistosoma mansoni]